jgi:hypothetical protein
MLNQNSNIDGVVTRTNIVHKSRGKYIIVDDTKDGKYINSMRVK